MNKLILLLLSVFAAAAIAAEPVPVYKYPSLLPAVKVKMSRTKKRQMNIYYASQANEINDNTPDTDADDLDIQVGYRRPEIAYNASTLEVDTIPDHILKRLEAARQQAVNRHRELWS